MPDCEPAMTQTTYVTITVDGRELQANEGENLLELLRRNRIEIPAPCYHGSSDRPLRCRLCLVHIGGREQLETACTVFVYNGMTVLTQSSAIEAARRRNLRDLFKQHYKEQTCADCIWNGGCELHELAKDWKIHPKMVNSTDS